MWNGFAARLKWHPWWAPGEVITTSEVRGVASSHVPEPARPAADDRKFSVRSEAPRRLMVFATAWHAR